MHLSHADTIKNYLASIQNSVNNHHEVRKSVRNSTKVRKRFFFVRFVVNCFPVVRVIVLYSEYRFLFPSFIEGLSPECFKVVTIVKIPFGGEPISAKNGELSEIQTDTFKVLLKNH